MTDTDDSATPAPGPRHAAVRVGLRTRLRGRTLAIAAVPTALLMGTVPSLAMADTPKDKACASAPDTVLEETPVPKSDLTPVPGPTATPTRTSLPTKLPTQRPVLPAPGPTIKAAAPQVAAAAPQAAPSPSATASSASVQSNGIIGDILDTILHPGGSSTPTPTPTAKPTPAPAPAKPTPSTTPAPGATPPASGAVAPATGTVPGAVVPSGTATAKPKAGATPSATASTGPNCTVDARGVTAKQASSGHVVPQQNWTLRSTRLALHGSVFNGVYDVKTPTGTKRVLKFTTASVDIGDLDMSTIEIPGKTFHVKSAPGSTSTMRSGPITMYVESLSGHLAEIIGLPIPIDLGEITITPDTLPKWLFDLISTVPIPLDLTLTNAKAVQAGQFGGTLKIPGMRLFNDDVPY
ncbi:hypothetical protein GCM10010193_20500 [Kitasatospora atroaurantiaca]|uniref:Uncharacterized protein n=1 Tax=Kitasatospora atroaurantiaca TaxID=285545 RepID=A0A561EVB7_9ACTN|nr:hypothetical protein [Kitasatospora atroaurantiaca]TWE19555.1 hypothetical protein FB465_4673 [Kitasatospora atroaurantiaca]